MDWRLGRGLHLDPYPGRPIFLPARIWAGCRGDSFDRGCCCRSAVLCAMAASVNTVLEAHACTLWLIFHCCCLGSLVIRWHRGSWVQLVESALASTRYQPVWIFKQQKMGGINPPTRRCTGRGFRFASPPPVSLTVGVAMRYLIIDI